MNKKVIAIIVVFAVVVIGAFVGLTFSSSMSGTGAGNNASNGQVTATGNKEAADNLIGESVTQEDVEDNVGVWKDFEMNSEGCERGVYAGIFYYDNFTIFSRTYDIGQTYEIVSVNE